jgi:hypothetical protein
MLMSASHDGTVRLWAAQVRFVLSFFFVFSTTRLLTWPQSYCRVRRTTFRAMRPLVSCSPTVVLRWSRSRSTPPATSSPRLP